MRHGDGDVAGNVGIALQALGQGLAHPHLGVAPHDLENIFRDMALTLVQPAAEGMANLGAPGAAVFRRRSGEQFLNVLRRPSSEARRVGKEWCRTCRSTW